MLDKKFWNQKSLVLPVLAILVVLAGSLLWVSKVSATPGSGAVARLLGKGNLQKEVKVRIKAKDGSKASMGVKEIQTYEITIVPGGITGWHQHGGPHIVVVASGTLTYYDGDDPTCTGVEYPAGSAILDPGFDTHFVRNEGSVDVVTYVTQLLPEGGTFRIDAPAPGNCGF